MKGAVILQGDARHIPMPDESVDLIITSPPYFALRSYRDAGEHYDGQIGSESTPREFLEALWACTAEWWRVLKPTGSLFVNLGDKFSGSGGHNNAGISAQSTLRGNGHTGGVNKDGHPNKVRITPRQPKATRRSAPDRYNQEAGGLRDKSLMGLPWLYALGCIGAWPFPGAMAGPDRWILRAEIIWAKQNSMPESVQDRVRRSHEQWFHLVKQGEYFSAIDEVREPYHPATAKRYEYGFNERSHDLERPSVRTELGGDTYSENPLGRLPGSVWEMATEPLSIPEAERVHYDLPQHFAAFPSEWPRRLILGWSPSEICTVCGEGQRPVTDRKPMVVQASPRRSEAQLDGEVSRTSMGGWMKEPAEARIIGYACACTPRTSHQGKRPPQIPRIEYHLDGWTPPPSRPAVVLDPFAGTGTVLGVARQLGRLGVGVDLSHDYCRLARWRVGRSGHFSKVAERTNRERQGVLL